MWSLCLPWYLPNKVKTQYLHFRVHAEYFHLPWKLLKKLTDNQCSSIGNIYYIKHMHIQPFSMEVDWQEIWCLIEVSAMFYICTYCVLTLWGSYCVAMGFSDKRYLTFCIINKYLYIVSHRIWKASVIRESNVFVMVS